MLTFLSSTLLTYILALAAIAFFTLLERKVLGYFQIRKGPNKVRISGVPQPIADAVKLFTKELSTPTFSNNIPFIASPLFSLILALILWSLYPTPSPRNYIIFGVLFFLIISRLRIYTTLAAGWTSNSKYSLLGALRGVAQTISYEVSISLILIASLIFINRFDFQFIFFNSLSSVALFLPILFFVWFVTLLAETNRTPFDFAEGERELVSGFNTEYSAGLFALIFIAEYINILILSLLSSIIFSFSIIIPEFEAIFLILTTFFLSFLFLWLRATLPRIRYDRLISLTWKSYLPISLIFLIINFQFIN